MSGVLRRSARLVGLYLLGILLIGGWSLAHLMGGTATRENLAAILVLPLAWTFGYWPVMGSWVLAWKLWRLQATLETWAERKALGLPVDASEQELEDTLTLLLAHPDRVASWDELKVARYRVLPPDRCYALMLPPPELFVNDPQLLARLENPVGSGGRFRHNLVLSEAAYTSAPWSGWTPEHPVGLAPVTIAAPWRCPDCHRECDESACPRCGHRAAWVPARDQALTDQYRIRSRARIRQEVSRTAYPRFGDTDHVAGQARRDPREAIAVHPQRLEVTGVDTDDRGTGL